MCSILHPLYIRLHVLVLGLAAIHFIPCIYHCWKGVQCIWAVSPCMVHQWLQVVYQHLSWVCLYPLYVALCDIAWRGVMPAYHMFSFVHPWLDAFVAYISCGLCVLVAGLQFCVLGYIVWMCLRLAWSVDYLSQVVSQCTAWMCLLPMCYVLWSLHHCLKQGFV